MIGLGCKHRWGRWSKDYIDFFPTRTCEKCNYTQGLGWLVAVRVLVIGGLILSLMLMWHWAFTAGEVDLRSDFQKAQEKAIDDCEYSGVPIIEKDADGVPVLKECKDL